MADPIPAVIVRDGQERSLHDLNRGDRIACRDFDPERRCYLFHVLTEVPASPEVTAAAEWSCIERGQLYWHPNGVPSSSCVECGSGPA